MAGKGEAVFMTEVALIGIPASGVLIMLNAATIAHAACRTEEDARLKAKPQSVAFALEKGNQASIAALLELHAELELERLQQQQQQQRKRLVRQQQQQQRKRHKK